MRRRKIKNQDPFIRTPSLTIGRTVIERGDIIKIQGEWGGRFKFHDHVVNPANGKEWIDCFEMQKGVACAWRSFHIDKVKPMPKKRGKRGSTTKTS